MLRVTGECVRVEQTPYEFDGRSGISRKARVLVGRADFVDVKFDQHAALPAEGELVDFAVTVRANAGRGGSDPRISYTVAGDWDRVVRPAPSLAL